MGGISRVQLPGTLMQIEVARFYGSQIHETPGKRGDRRKQNGVKWKSELRHVGIIGV